MSLETLQALQVAYDEVKVALAAMDAALGNPDETAYGVASSACREAWSKAAKANADFIRIVHDHCAKAVEGYYLLLRYDHAERRIVTYSAIRGEKALDDPDRTEMYKVLDTYMRDVLGYAHSGPTDSNLRGARHYTEIVSQNKDN